MALFVAKFRELYPQHFAMFFLMLVTGLRPSSVRPLRRRRAECAEVLDVLRWHVDTQLAAPEQEDSDLLFPAVTGGFRTQKVLNVPIAETAEELGIKKHLTQRALRRTFNDLARAAQVSRFPAVCRSRRRPPRRARPARLRSTPTRTQLGRRVGAGSRPERDLR